MTAASIGRNPIALMPWKWILGFLITTRMLFLFVAPLADPTEARFAEISRKMVETRDWIIPQLAYGEPCLENPPLAMWLSATGIELFGSNEFGARALIFLSAVTTLGLVASVRGNGVTSGIVAPALLMAMPLFYYTSAAVTTGAPLLLGVTLSMISFRAAICGSPRWRSYGLFAGMVLGLLTSGTVALALILPPIAVWTVLTNSWRRVWHTLPWCSGSLLGLLLVVPWYVLVNQQSPGFASHYLLVEGWRPLTGLGSMVNPGTAPAGTNGMFWLSATLPLLLLGCIIPLRKWRESEDRSGVLLGWVWAVWPWILFAASPTVLATCPLCSLPAIAILLATGMSGEPGHGPKRALAGALVALSVMTSPALGLVATVLRDPSERELIRMFEQSQEDEDQLIYFGSIDASAEFYTDGSALHTRSATLIRERMDAPGRLFVAMRPSDLALLSETCRRRLQPLSHWGDGRKNLYVERTDLPRLEGIDPENIHAIGS